MQMDSNVLRHVVVFRYKAGTTGKEIARITKAFGQLAAGMPGVLGFEWGVNNSPEGLDQGFTHCYQLTFRSEADRDAYLPHPEHKAFGQLLGPHLDGVFVVDYWAKTGMED